MIQLTNKGKASVFETVVYATPEYQEIRVPVSEYIEEFGFEAEFIEWLFANQENYSFLTQIKVGKEDWEGVFDGTIYIVSTAKLDSHQWRMLFLKFESDHLDSLPEIYEGYET